MAFITTAEVKAYLRITVSTDDSLLGGFVTSAQRYIEDKTRRTLTPVTKTRYYKQADNRVQGQLLQLDEDLLSLTGLTNGNDTVIDTSTVFLQPANLGPPYTSIRLKYSGTSVWQFNLDGQIAVTGIWGYTDDPAFTAGHSALKQWGIQLAAWMYRRAGSTNSDSDRTIVTGDGTTIMPSAVPKDILDGIMAHRRLPR